jgi:hypothetical protein
MNCSSRVLINAKHIACAEGSRLVANPLEFEKVFYNVSRKTKVQIEASLNLEIRYLEDQNPKCQFKECRQGRTFADSIRFTIVFEKLLDERKA